MGSVKAENTSSEFHVSIVNCRRDMISIKGASYPTNSGYTCAFTLGNDIPISPSSKQPSETMRYNPEQMVLLD